MAMTMQAAEHVYTWGTEFQNYKSQMPSSDFTTADGLFRFTTEKAQGTSGPQFDEDSKAGLLLRLYADNTLQIESLKGEKITAITFVIGGNGHYKLADLTPSTGEMDEPYLGKDATDTFREYVEQVYLRAETIELIIAGVELLEVKHHFRLAEHELHKTRERIVLHHAHMVDIRGRERLAKGRDELIGDGLAERGTLRKPVEQVATQMITLLDVAIEGDISDIGHGVHAGREHFLRGLIDPLWCRSRVVMQVLRGHP